MLSKMIVSIKSIDKYMPRLNNNFQVTTAVCSFTVVDSIILLFKFANRRVNKKKKLSRIVFMWDYHHSLKSPLSEEYSVNIALGSL